MSSAFTQACGRPSLITTPDPDQPDAAANALFADTSVFPADAAGMDAVHALLARVWEVMDRTLGNPPESLWRMYLATAVGEIAANIITHAYRDAPAGATAVMDAHLFPDRLTITFRDRGAPWPGDAPTTSDPDDLAESGRGITLARAAVDALTYTRTPNGENVWVLEKRFAATT